MVKKILAFAQTHEHDLDKKGEQYPTVLECARRGHKEVLGILSTARYDMEVVDKAGMTPLLLASWTGRRDVVDLLIRIGCNTHATTRSGETAIHLAARSEEIDVLSFLLDFYPHRFNLDVRDREGRTAMHILAGNGDVDTICRMIRAGAHVNLKDNAKKSPAHVAITSGFDDVLAIFLDQDIDPRQRDSEGRALIHLATEAGKTSAVRTLVEFNFDTSATDVKGRTALHVASSLGNKDIINLLLNNCASLEARDLKGNRPLHLACQYNQVSTVTLLLSKGAQVDAINCRCQTALHIASELGHKDVVEVLVAFGADLSFTERCGRTALYIAARGGHTEIVDFLIKSERQMNLDSSEINHNIVQRRLSITSADSHEDVSSTDQVVNALEEGLATQMQDVVAEVARQHLHPEDWIRLARFWEFEEDQIKAIEHQYTGRGSYKEHCYRLMIIWLHSLPSNRHPMRELFVSLMAIGRGSVAKKVVNKATTTTKFLYDDDQNRCLRLFLSKCRSRSCCIS
jgi:ankyrin repeat protein